MQRRPLPDATKALHVRAVARRRMGTTHAVHARSYVDRMGAFRRQSSTIGSATTAIKRQRRDWYVPTATVVWRTWSSRLRSEAASMPIRRTTAKITQDEYNVYWSSKWLVERFEQRIMSSGAVSVQPGELTLPALRAKGVA